MVAAAVVAAGVLLAVMMVAGGALRADQSARQQLRHPLVRVAGAAGVQPDARFRQRHLGAAADAAADQGIHLVCLQEARQGPVAAAVGVHHLGGDDRAVLHVIELELCRVTEVLEHLAVFIGDCDFHDDASFPFWEAHRPQGLPQPRQLSWGQRA